MATGCAWNCCRLTRVRAAWMADTLLRLFDSRLDTGSGDVVAVVVVWLRSDRSAGYVRGQGTRVYDRVCWRRLDRCASLKSKIAFISTSFLIAIKKNISYLQNPIMYGKTGKLVLWKTRVFGFKYTTSLNVRGFYTFWFYCLRLPQMYYSILSQEIVYFYLDKWSGCPLSANTK